MQWNRTETGLLVRDDSTDVATRPALNLIAGSNVTLTVADDAANDEVDVTIAASVPGGGAPAASATGKLDTVHYTSGNLSLASTSWASAGAGDLTVNCSAGEWVKVGVSCIVFGEANNLNLDFATVVSGTPTNYVGPGGGTSNQGIPGLFCTSGVASQKLGEYPYEVAAGDVVSGQVTFRFMYRTGSASPSRTIAGTAGSRLTLWAHVLG